MRPEDSEQFGQRAKFEDYDDFVFLVVYGAVPDEDRLVERVSHGASLGRGGMSGWRVEPAHFVEPSLASR